MVRKLCIILLLVLILSEVQVQLSAQVPSSVTCNTVSTVCSDCELMVRQDQFGNAWFLNRQTRTLQSLNITTSAQREYSLISAVYNDLFEGYSGTDFWVSDQNTVVFLSQYKQSLFILNLNDQSIQRIPLLSQAYACTLFGDNRSFQLTGDLSSQRLLSCSIRQDTGQPFNTINLVDIQTGIFQEIIAIRGSNGGYRPWITTLIGDDGRVYLQPGGHSEINEVVPSLASLTQTVILSRGMSESSWDIIELPDVPLGILQHVDAGSNMYFRGLLANAVTKVSSEGVIIWQIPSSELEGVGAIVEVLNDGRFLTLNSQNGDVKTCSVVITTPTPMPTLIAPPHGGGGGIPACPGGGGEWVWIDGVPVFVCGTLIE